MRQSPGPLYQKKQMAPSRIEPGWMQRCGRSSEVASVTRRTAPTLPPPTIASVCCFSRSLVGNQLEPGSRPTQPRHHPTSWSPWKRCCFPVLNRVFAFVFKTRRIQHGFDPNIPHDDKFYHQHLMATPRPILSLSPVVGTVRSTAPADAVASPSYAAPSREKHRRGQ
jgi:hypothetical protein